VRLVPLPGRSEDAVRIALLSHGWGGDLARSTADGVESLAFHVAGVGEATLLALVQSGARLGLEVVTGDDWAVLTGSRARLSSLARPWTSPEPLQELAAALGHALPAEEAFAWQTARGPIALDQPVIMGILDLTRDGFGGGGNHNTRNAALRRAEVLLAEGATVLDLGGEFSRPGTAPIGEAEELARVVSVLEALDRHFGRGPGKPAAWLSVDTTSGAVAAAALDAGAAIVNDVSAFRIDPRMAPLAASRKPGVVLIHSRGVPGGPADPQQSHDPGGVLPAVVSELGGCIGRARAAGIPAGHLVADPGLGFGKSTPQSLALLRGLRTLRVLGVPLMVGPSRTRFLGEVTGQEVDERDTAAATACAMAWQAGARLFRVHHPAAARDALRLMAAVHPA